MGYEAERKANGYKPLYEAKAFTLSIEQNNVDVKYEQDETQAETPKPATPPKAESKGGQGNMPF